MYTQLNEKYKNKQIQYMYDLCTRLNNRLNRFKRGGKNCTTLASRENGTHWQVLEHFNQKNMTYLEPYLEKVEVEG